MSGLYNFTTGAFGLSCLVIGAGFLVEPGKERVRRAFGALFLGLGSAYSLSWLSGFRRLPLSLDNLLIPAIVFVISQSLFEISLYVFGDEAVSGSRRKVYLTGAAWSAALWLMPFLDSALGLSPIGSSVEDGRTMALFQTVSSAGVYVWPVAITIVSFRAGRRHPADLPRKPGVTWTFLAAFSGVIVALVVIGLSMAASSTVGYRAGHASLQLMMLCWFLYYRARPDAFRQARKEIERRHEQRESLSPAEAAAIAERLGKAVDADKIHALPDLSLSMLARKLKLPAYKLSAYFNGALGMSFPAWLNATRVERVRRLLVEKPEESILDVAMEAGYASKTVFNAQFRRLVGMSPSEYRDKNRG
jgi:AraC-like DNA-binding protein